MKKTRGMTVFFIIFAVIAISILIMHYSLSYNYRKQPPSAEWSKEVLVSNGTQNEAAKPYPKIISIDTGYIIAHQDGPSVKLVKTDHLGKKLIEKTFEQGTDFIKYINLLSNDEYIYLYAVAVKDSERSMNCIRLDKDLNSVENWIIDDVDSAVQIEKDVLITVYKDKIEVLNIKNNTKVNMEVENAKLVSGTKINDRYMVSYQESDKYFKYFYINSDWSASEAKLAGIMSPDNKSFFEKANLACDDEYGYIFVSAVDSTYRFGRIKYLQFSFDGKMQDVKDFRQAPFREIYNPIAASSGDTSRFIAGSSRQYAKKEAQFDIIEYYFEDGKMKDYTIASKTKAASLYPAIYGDTIIFMDNSEKGYNIYMASRNEEFKAANNGTRPYESSMALADVKSGFMFSVFYTFIYGIRWIIVGLVLISSMSYITYSMKDRTKLVFFTATYLITAVIKLYSIYNFFYIENGFMLPDALHSPVLGLAICFAISIPCWLYGLRRYGKNLESIPFISFSMALFIDSVLTQMIFVPFIA